MKKHVLSSLAMALTLGASAQLPDGSIAPDFTATDINGNTWHLYDLLNDGYTVVLDISATWCGPCWSYHNGGALEGLYDTYGPGTSYDKVMVFMIEGDHATTNADLLGTGSNTQGNWVTGTPYPIIDDNSTWNLNDAYAISYFPTIYTICPNRVLTESGQQSMAAHWSDAQVCPIADSPNDGALLNSLEQMTACAGTPLALKARLQNMGTSNLTSATIQAKQGATVLGSTNWSGNLGTYDFAEVTVTNYTFPAGTANINYVITTTDDDAANNTATGSAVVSDDEMGTQVVLELLTDNYGEETDWELYDNGVLVAQDPAGAYADNTTFTYTWNLPDAHCMTFKIYDAYGDGICCDFGNGYYKLSTGGVVMIQGGAFTTEETKPFATSAAVGVSEASLADGLNIYPNPTNGLLNVQMPNVKGTLMVDVYSLLGDKVISSAITTTMNTVDMSKLTNGVYYLNITGEGVNTTRKVTVNK